jgi:hypothetical protein
VLRAVWFDDCPDLLAVFGNVVHTVTGAEGVHQESAAAASDFRPRQRSRSVEVPRWPVPGRLIVNVHPDPTPGTSKQELDGGLPMAHGVADQLRYGQHQGLDDGVHPKPRHEPAGLLSSYAGCAGVVGEVVPLRDGRFITGRGARVHLGDHVDRDAPLMRPYATT